MQFLSPKAHGAIDYIAALALILAPFVIGLEQIALWLSVGIGVLAVVAVSSTAVEAPIGASA